MEAWRPLIRDFVEKGQIFFAGFDVGAFSERAARLTKE